MRSALLAALGLSGCLAMNTSGHGASSTGADGEGSTGTTTGGGLASTGSAAPFAVALTLTRGTIDFGFQPIESKSIRCVGVGNPADQSVTITGLGEFQTAGNAYALSQVDDATPPNPAPIPVVVPGGGSARVCFSFSPTITQQYSGHATLSTDDPLASNTTIRLTAWADGPQISCMPLTIDFGETLDHSVATVPVICTNTGTAIPGFDLWISPTFVGTRGFTATITVPNGSAPLDGLVPGQSTQIDVNLAPDSDAAGILYLDTNLPGGSPVKWTIDAQSNGQPTPCAFSIAPALLDFGTIPAGSISAPQAITIANLGDGGCFAGGFDLPRGFEVSSLSLAESTNDAGVESVAILAGERLEIGVEFAPPDAGGFGGNFATVEIKGRGL